MLRQTAKGTYLRTAAGLFLLLSVLTGCGDVCLFCADGDGGGNGGGNGTEQTCDNVFPGLDAFPQVESVIDGFSQTPGEEDRLSLAVIPKGMSFSYPPGTGTRSAEAGDVILADQQGEDILIYDFSGGNAKRILLAGYRDVSGLALLHQEVDESTAYDFLFFTVNTEDTLYICDLAETATPPGLPNPFPITNTLAGAGFFASPTALAISADQDKVAVFVLNDNGRNSSVKRLSVSLTTWLPESPRTLATMGESETALVDLAYFSQTDTLFISKKRTEFLGGWVYSIANASVTTRNVDLDTTSFFIRRDQRVTGLAIAPTTRTETAAALLLLRENIAQAQVEQYRTAVGGETPDFVYTPTMSFDFLQVVEYDCTNRRLLFTNVPLNDDFDRAFFEAFPLQP